MKQNVTLVIQARMGSSRLPGKMLMPLHQGKSMLHWLIQRIQTSSCVTHVVVATSSLPEDDAIVEECNRLEVTCARGSDWDVLDRFYHAASLCPSPWVMRVCGDSPLIHGELLDFVVEEYSQRGVDYFSNGNEPPLAAEDGFCAEIFTMAHLKEAAEKAEWMSEREHVTPYIKKNPMWTKAWKQYRSSYHYKLSVDTVQDFEHVQFLFDHFADPLHAGMDEVLKLVEQNQEMFAQHDALNAGYTKSLAEDKKVNR